MPSTEKIRADLQKKLSELFQLDQPDLDFGFYRIMHAKAEEVGNFINTDLLKDVEETFGKIDDAQKTELKSQYENAVQQAKEYGAPNPEEAPKVKEAKAAYESYKSGASAEADVYEHLLRFFSRYYETGDFISRRYYARETTGKAAPFAIPYNGEEVKLHWANADQYYVKSTDYFSNFTFDLSQTNADKWVLPNAEKIEPLRVHFRIISASEGEHSNIKTSADSKRFFLLYEKEPVHFDENGELVINFEYRNDPKKTGQDGTWQDRRNAEAVVTLQRTLENTDNAAEYRTALFALAPTEKNAQRMVLAKYLSQYTARNTMDYFIHKNLGEFLHRELDFYIKNEVMRLDDIESADVPTVQSYLEKIKVIRKIAGKLIDFLAQLEDFQKKLWLKKKFVTETNYCITLDRIPEEFYKEIAANKAQHEEWVKLFAIDEIAEQTGDLFVGECPAYSNPLTTAFLKANNKLVLDTKFFSEDFKARLVATIENFDEQCDGLLIHSENFQALNLLQERYREQIKCVYIDPPYNTTENAFLYKNLYKHSSWTSMMDNRVAMSETMVSSSGVVITAIDDTEFSNIKQVLSQTFGHDNHVATIPVEVNPAGQNIRPNVPARSHDYFHIYSKDIERVKISLRELSKEEKAVYKFEDKDGKYYWDNLRRRGGNSRPTDRPKQWFPLFVLGEHVRVPKMEWNESEKKWMIRDSLKKGETEAWPIDPHGEKRIWRVNPDGARKKIKAAQIAVIEKSGRQEISLKSREPKGKKPKTLWYESKYSATSHGTKLLQKFFKKSNLFSYPKSVYLVTDAIRYWIDDTNTVIDYFAGSGTTGHAVLNLNREDGGQRKYVLVEMGNYFASVLKPRMQKVVYSTEWRSGKPQNRVSGISHCFKYIRLESYEDTLNNLRFDTTASQSKLLQKSKPLREDYMLRYMLDVETRGSQSLLNIDAFAEPDKYLLRVKEAASDATAEKAVDLLETFNYLLGLRVEKIQAPQRFTAKFKRLEDPDIPEDQQKKLVLNGSLKQNDTGEYSFRAVYGWMPKNPFTPNDGLREKVLIVWRNLTDDLEKDNTVLDEWFRKNRINPRDFEFDTIYVNGCNNLPNIKRDDENWRVKWIEEEFFKRMWNVERV